MTIHDDTVTTETDTELHAESPTNHRTEPLLEAPVHRESSMRSSRTRFEPDALVAGAAGLVLAVTGLIVLIRAGLTSPLSSPVVEVAGFTHTATLGIIEAGAGLAFLLSAASRSRGAATLFGVGLGVAGFVGAVQNDSFTTSLALETSLAWLLMLLGIVVAAAALALPRFAMRTATTDTPSSASSGSPSQRSH